MAHRIIHFTKTGAKETLRLSGAPDCDSAAMFVADTFGSNVKSVEAVDDDLPRGWGEMDAGAWKNLDAWPDRLGGDAC